MGGKRKEGKKYAKKEEKKGERRGKKAVLHKPIFRTAVCLFTFLSLFNIRIGD